MHTFVRLAFGVLLVLSVSSAVAQSKLTQERSKHDTCATALALSADSHMAGVEKQYEWLRANYPNHQLAQQELISCAGKPTDAMAMVNEASGTYVIVLFDLSGYFGKGLGL